MTTKKIIIVLLLIASFTGCDKESEPKGPLAVVTVFTRENCPISENMCFPLRNTYRYFCDTLAKDILFRGFVPTFFSSEESIEEFRETFDIPFPLTRDWDDTGEGSSIGNPGLYTQQYSPTVTPEVFVEFNDELVYSGMINNSYVALGDYLPPTEHYLLDVLTKIVNGEELEPMETTAIGCNI